MVCYPYFLCVIVAVMLPENHFSAVLFLILVAAVCAVRLSLLGILTFVTLQQVVKNAGDNMIGVLQLLEVVVFAPLQTFLSILFGGFSVWNRRRL